MQSHLLSLQRMVPERQNTQTAVVFSKTSLVDVRGQKMGTVVPFDRKATVAQINNYLNQGMLNDI